LVSGEEGREARVGGSANRSFAFRRRRLVVGRGVAESDIVTFDWKGRSTTGIANDETRCKSVHSVLVGGWTEKRGDESTVRMKAANAE
jgi:hypothetical protein